jgi:hypothetical protein
VLHSGWLPRSALELGKLKENRRRSRLNEVNGKQQTFTFALQDIT